MGNEIAVGRSETSIGNIERMTDEDDLETKWLD